MAKKNGRSGNLSRLMILGRDLNRTFLHGSRPEVNTQVHKPAAIVTGQQIKVDVPDKDPMNFQFELNGQKQLVPVTNKWARDYRDWTTNVVSKPGEYFALSVDDRVPTWVFHQREYGFPLDRIPPEDVLELADKKTALRIPVAALQEAQRVAKLPGVDRLNGGDVSLWKYDRNTQKPEVILRKDWKPAILLRFPLKEAEAVQVERATENVFEIFGTPQGERYYLDRLNLFSPGDPCSQITGVSFYLEEKPPEPGKQRKPADPITNWTIARINLTEEARPGNQLRQTSDTITRPFVATNDEPCDALRLLQMLSITNSGGYYLRVPSAIAYATLVVCVTLSINGSDELEKVPLPLAANAIVYESGTVPEVMRFEGIESIQVSPFAPTGYVAFGWTRPRKKKSPEELFAYQTISLIEYSGVDGENTSWQKLEEVVPISPLSALPAEYFEKNDAVTLGDAAGDTTREGAGVAAMRLHSRHHYDTFVALNRIARVNEELSFYRGQMCCYHKKEGESPYAPLANDNRRTITVRPGLRDVFGNRFEAVGGEIKRRLFYTDALRPPAEWPGFRFSMFPTTDAGRLCLGLEASYTPTENENDKWIRYYRLIEIRDQLRGARSDVKVALSATPLLSTEIDLTKSLIAWLTDTLIPLEKPGEKQKRQPIPKANPVDSPKPFFMTGLKPFPCRTEALKDLTRFQPKIEIRRTDNSLLPQNGELPQNETLAQIIRDEITQTSSSVFLAIGPSPYRFRESTRKDEFLQVARAFGKTFAVALGVKMGILRNQINEHELYFIPTAMFPAAPSDPSEQRKWTYSTPRPLNNTLETDVFPMPVFDGKVVANPQGTFHDYPVRAEPTHFVDQDYDELGRTAFALVERAMTPLVATDPSNSEYVKNILGAKDAVARTLSNWGGLKDFPSYMIPVFAAENDADGPSVSRLAKDAFLKTLTAFYNVDTVVQLPIDSKTGGGDGPIAMFFGRANAKFTSIPPRAGAAAPPIRLPALSDVLFEAGRRKVTLLYDVPAGTRDPNSLIEVPVITKSDDLKVVFTHVQLKEGAGSRSTGLAFNEGPWLELVADQPESPAFETAWSGSGKPIPVAVRRFPEKPSLEVPKSVPAKLHPPSSVAGVEGVRRLIKWGWEISFLAEGNVSDIIHTKIRYNEPENESSALSYRSNGDWQPRNLLHCLLTFKAVNDHWDKISAEKRLPVLSSLMTSLRQELEKPRVLKRSTTSQPCDLFDVVFDGHNNASIENGQYAVMLKPECSTTDLDNTDLRRVTLKALGELDSNKGVLLGALGEGVYNFRPSLRLTRNEKINGLPLDSRLIYERAVVESASECRARNSWTGVLKYVPSTKMSLQESLQEFFTALLNGANLSSLDLEVSSSLHYRRKGLEVLTPFSLIPSDMMPKVASPIVELAHRLNKTFETFVEHNLPQEVDDAWLQLRVKVSRPNPERTAQRTLVEIAAIDFPLL